MARHGCVAGLSLFACYSLRTAAICGCLCHCLSVPAVHTDMMHISGAASTNRSSKRQEPYRMRGSAPQGCYKMAAVHTSYPNTKRKDSPSMALLHTLPVDCANFTPKWGITEKKSQQMNSDLCTFQARLEVQGLSSKDAGGMGSQCVDFRLESCAPGWRCV